MLSALLGGRVPTNAHVDVIAYSRSHILLACAVSLSRKVYRVTSLDRLEAVALTSQVTHTVDLPGTPTPSSTTAQTEKQQAASTSSLVAAAMDSTAAKRASSVSPPPPKWPGLAEAAVAQGAQQLAKGQRQRLPPLQQVKQAGDWAV